MALTIIIMVVFGLSGDFDAPGFASKYAQILNLFYFGCGVDIHSLSLVEDVLYISLSRAAWGVVLLWLLFVCETRRTIFVHRSVVVVVVFGGGGDVVVAAVVVGRVVALNLLILLTSHSSSSSSHPINT